MSVTLTARLEVWRSRIEYQGVILGVICAVITLLLLLGDRSTRTDIQQREMEDRLASLGQVLPTSLYDNNPLAEVIMVNDAALSPAATAVYPARRGGILQGLALQVSTVGYGGPIQLMIAMDKEGTILGVRVLSHKETPGLADKIERQRSDWITAFEGGSLANTETGQWAVKKDGGKFDQFAGATITPRAVVKGVYLALQFYDRHRQELVGPLPGTPSTGEHHD